MMKELYRKLSFTLAGMLLFVSSLLAQQRTVTGTVTDENGSAMPGVNVVVKGTSNGTATDGSGNFSLQVPGDDAVLVISFVGYANTEVTVGTRTTIDVQLAPDLTTLSELVVTGYAIQEKKDITGSVGIISSKDLVAVPAPTPEAQIQGRVAGVNVSNTGVPGAGSTVRIRGFSTLNNRSTGNPTSGPLYIVDGVPTYDVTTFNSYDIESITVLKDAGAASIYGARASNGVIVVATKKGPKNGKVSVSYDMYYGWQDPGKGFTNLLNTQEMANLEWLAKTNDGLPLSSDMYGAGPTPTIPDYILPSGQMEGDPDVNPALYDISYANGEATYQITRANKKGTNWFDEVTRVAPIQMHNLSVAGGNENSRYFLGLNYFDQKGIIVDTYAKRFSLRANSEATIKKVVRVGENVVLSYRTFPQGTGAGNGNNFNNLAEGNAISQSYRIQPIVPVYDIMGNFAGSKGADLGNGNNPVANQKRTANNLVTGIRTFGNIYAEADFMPWLTGRTSFGGSLTNVYAYNYVPRSWENSENPPSNAYGEFSQIQADWVWTNTFTVRKSFGDSKLTVVGGSEAVKANIGRNMAASRINYFVDDPDFISLDRGSAGQTNSGAPFTPATLFSLFARADYSFKDKYYLSATVRRDGSSKFSESKKYGTFPSVTAMWRISNEQFFSSITAVNDLKIRGGWGRMGNQEPVSPDNTLTSFAGAVNTTAYDITGANTGSVVGFRETTLGNTETQWETNETTNFGIDASAFDSKLTFTFDWYKKVTKDLLYEPELTAFFGQVNSPALNVAQMTNSGVEFQLEYKTELPSGIRFDITGTVSANKNKLDKVDGVVKFFAPKNNPEENRLGDRFVRNAVGQPISSYYGYKVIGINEEADTLGTFGADNRDMRQTGGLPGTFKFADTNNDGVVTEEDKVFLGSPIPDFTYGLNINVGWKNFDLTVFFYGVQGNEIMNFTKWWTDFPGSFRGGKSKAALYDSWTLERRGGKVPMASYSSAYSTISTNKSSNSYYMEDGSYLRARNVQLTYSLPRTLLDRFGIERARVYIQGVNLFTITDYSGLNPELGQTSDTAMGIDLGNYPTPKQYTLGLNVTF